MREPQSGRKVCLPNGSLFFRAPFLSGLPGWDIVLRSSNLTFSTSRCRYSNWYSSLYEKEYRAGEDWVVLTRCGDVINLPWLTELFGWINK